MRQKFPDVERPKILQASQNSLWNPEGKQALEYLRKERGLSDDVIRRFQVGYCPASVDHELAGRIIMPLYDSAGDEIVAFTSRNPDAPKRFQHWHESFDKSRYLYGFHLAKEPIRKRNKVIIVEGQFDTMCLHSYGFNMTVGLCGTSLSIMHVTLLTRYSNEFYFLLDSDEGGETAMERCWKMYRTYVLDQLGILFIPVILPKKVDPDDFVRERGIDALVELLRISKEKAKNG